MVSCCGANRGRGIAPDHGAARSRELGSQGAKELEQSIAFF
jgi:hypothetical protein